MRRLSSFNLNTYLRFLLYRKPRESSMGEVSPVRKGLSEIGRTMGLLKNNLALMLQEEDLH